jgi:chemotaxis response regulator CheB
MFSGIGLVALLIYPQHCGSKQSGQSSQSANTNTSCPLDPPVNHHRSAVDVLFNSSKGNAVGVILTVWIKMALRK